MRENYRINKVLLLETVIQCNQHIRLLFTLSKNAYKDHSKIDFSHISADMPVLLDQVIKNVSKKQNILQTPAS